MSIKKLLLYLVVLAVILSLARHVWMIQPVPQASSEPRAAFVHLFEWSWPDIARECETFLGPQGYTAVQISPPHEHVKGEQWWTRYQPVSYRLESRGGNRDQFVNMVSRCRAAGVGIYADAVINHMSAVGEGSGVAGSQYRRYEYPVPYGYDDFHHCGRYGDDMIRSYQDAWEVRNCELGNLADLATGKRAVQERISTYLGDLVDTGVTGFRIDAAKHMEPADITAILEGVPGQPFVYQEVIDRGSEPIKGVEYTGNGHVAEFRYGMALFTAFSNRDLSALQTLGSGDGWVPSERAVVFIDNHDVQRGHAGADEVLTHQDWDTYELANIFMLAWPYGYPMVMSSYRISDSDHGPPPTQPVDGQGLCADQWVCEHREPAIAAMVRFRRETHGQPMTAWKQINSSAVAFSRGDAGFVAINSGTSAVSARFPVGLKPGRYRDILRTTGNDDDENGDLVVAADRTVSVSLPPMSAIATDLSAVK